MFTSLRSKLMTAFVLTILLPLIPLTFVVKNLIDESIELGVNEHTKRAFESAVNVAQENLTIRQNTVASQAQVIANLSDIRNSYLNHDYLRLHMSVDEWAGRLQVQAVQIFDVDYTEDSLTELVSREVAADPSIKTEVNRLFQPDQPEQLVERLEDMSENNHYILDIKNGNSNAVKAWAPIRTANKQIVGFVVVTQVGDPAYINAYDRVMNALQQYQTIGGRVTPLSTEYLLTFVAVALIMLIISSLASVVITNSIVRPIFHLVKGTREIASGNLDYQVETKSKDEIRLLVEGFNKMAQNLKESQHRLLRSERIAAWQEMARRLAHEIKNPLTPIQLSMQHLRDRYYQKDNHFSEVLEECTETIFEEVASLRKMVNTFSEFARLPRSDPQLDDVNRILENVIGLYRDSHLHLKIITKLNELPPIMIDSEQFKRVFHNLIQNAIEAMNDNGILTISTYLAESQVVISFIDTGPGISENIRTQLFEPYFTTKPEGTGLGLAIVNRIVQDHFGEILIENHSEGGAIVTIQLPLA